MTRVAVLGGGIAGCLAALRLVASGRTVTLFDERGPEAHGSCSHAAAGMLAPVTEGAHGGAQIASWGQRSLALWPKILESLDAKVPFDVRGTVAAATDEDRTALEDLTLAARRHAPDASIRTLTPQELAHLEPGLAHQNLHAVHFEGEGRIDNHAALDALRSTLKRRGVTWRVESVRSVEPGRIRLQGETATFDSVFDCRGLGAAGDLRSLRGVRGETAILDAPEVVLSRPLRVMHPRYPIYIVPRGPGRFVIGATSIESASREPVSVTSALELLGAAYAAHPGFRFASIAAFVADARPAFFDHRPRVLATPGLIRINGLYRHGFLLAPLVTEAALTLYEGGTLDADLASLTEVPPCST